MTNRVIKLSKEFKNNAVNAILAIGFFIISYLIILALAFILTGLCIAGGILIIKVRPMFITIALGIGLASMGILILIFLLKIFFKSHKVDRSHLFEIKEEQEPELFIMIREISKQVRTSFPKKIYLSSDVNASVFYDSSFWSMFLPVRKNLNIGLGLVNTVTKEELKAILAHEFGHFSQKSMKVGSYVFNVNQIIYNMLFDNKSYEELVQTWANVSNYFTIFVVIAIKINEEIQKILRQLYIIVNKNYLGLSREMEFHADAIAASVTGYEPLKKSLLRMSMADNSFTNVLDFYERRISENIISHNLYRDQSAVINFLAESNNLPLTNNLPDISLEEQSKYKKSKLFIADQWSSHPTVEERIIRLEQTGFLAGSTYDCPANDIFLDAVKIQKQITDQLIKTLNFSGETTALDSEKFIKEYKKESEEGSFPKRYNGYYDQKNPVIFDLEVSKLTDENITFNDLYSDAKVDLVYTVWALKNDIQTLVNISAKTSSIKTYDYNGIRYKREETDKLIEKLKPEQARMNELIKINDSDIYEFFKKEEKDQNKPSKIKQLYSDFFEFDQIFDSKYKIYTDLMDAMSFTHVTTPVDQIKENLRKIIPLEKSLKKEINLILSDNGYASEITPEIRISLEKYATQTLDYFGATIYIDANLKILYTALHNFALLLSRRYFLMKKNILIYQEELIQEKTR